MGRRYKELDILRGLSIIGVLLIHISSHRINDNVGLFINQISRFAVPSFLFLSGMGLTLSNKLNEGYLNFIVNLVSKILPPYLLWNILYYLVNEFEGYSIIGFTKGVVLGTNAYHLYYVPITIFLYLIYPILLKIAAKAHGLVIVLIITIISQHISLIINIDIFNLPQNVCNWIFYFVLGIWFSDNFPSKLLIIKQNKLIIRTLFICTLFGILSESNILNVTTSMRASIILYTTSFILFIFSFEWNKNFIKMSLLNLSKKTYGIYLSHVIVLMAIDFLYITLEVRFVSSIYIAVTFVSVILLSTMIALVMNLLVNFIKS